MGPDIETLQVTKPSTDFVMANEHETISMIKNVYCITRWVWPCFGYRVSEVRSRIKLCNDSLSGNRFDHGSIKKNVLLGQLTNGWMWPRFLKEKATLCTCRSAIQGKRREDVVFTYRRIPVQRNPKSSDETRVWTWVKQPEASRCCEKPSLMAKLRVSP